MPNFDFLEKSMGIVIPPSTEYDSLRKMFNMLHSINWSDFIVWLPLLLEMLGNMFVVIVCFPGCDVVIFEINLVSNQAVFTWPKNQDKNLNILGGKELLKWDKKLFFIIFKGLSVAKNCLRFESAPLIHCYFKFTHIILITLTTKA